MRLNSLDVLDRVSSIHRDLLVIQVREQNLLKEVLVKCGSRFVNEDEFIIPKIHFNQDGVVEATVIGVELDEKLDFIFDLEDELGDKIELNDIHTVIAGDLAGIALLISEQIQDNG